MLYKISFRSSILLLATTFLCLSLSYFQPAQSFSPPDGEIAAQLSNGDPQPPSEEQNLASTEFILPPLPYGYDALEPYIDATTMTIHHDKHHAGYVKNLNEEIAFHPELQNNSVESLLLNLDKIPPDIQNSVRNNGGGHANHTMFWSIMSSHGGGEPIGEIADALNTAFGNFDTFKQEFNEAGKTRFGSGWVWLVLNERGQLEITTTANQDSPLMTGKYPLLGNDVWEHAYYLNYQNNRGDYLDNWWNVVNWQAVNQLYLSARERSADKSLPQS